MRSRVMGAHSHAMDYGHHHPKKHVQQTRHRATTTIPAPITTDVETEPVSAFRKTIAHPAGLIATAAAKVILYTVINLLAEPLSSQTMNEQRVAKGSVSSSASNTTLHAIRPSKRGHTLKNRLVVDQRFFSIPQN